MLQTEAQKVPVAATVFEQLRLVLGTCRLRRGRLTAQGSCDVIEHGCNGAVVSSLKAASMSEARRRLLITLVHGTWGRGFLPQTAMSEPTPFVV